MKPRAQPRATRSPLWGWERCQRSVTGESELDTLQITLSIVQATPLIRTIIGGAQIIDLMMLVIDETKASRLRLLSAS